MSESPEKNQSASGEEVTILKESQALFRRTLKMQLENALDHAGIKGAKVEVVHKEDGVSLTVSGDLGTLQEARRALRIFELVVEYKEENELD